MGNHTIEEDNLEVYTPEIGESEDIGIDQTTTSYSPRLNKLKEGETIQVELNQKAIKWRISHDLYKDFKSGVRELFQNEARACRQARDKFNAKPKIIVKINSDTKALSIQGIDSLGISEAVFDKVLRVLGVSGNTDGGNEVGQFGMGFASYTTISDIIMVETWYRENREDGSEQRFAFLGDNGIDFKILPEPELDTFGTKMSMTYNDTVDERGMIDMLSECAKFCGVKVELVVEADWNTYHEFGQIGVYELETFKDVEDCLDKQLNKILIEKGIYDEENNHIKESKYEIDYFKKVHINNDDYEFVGIIAIMQQKDSDYNNFINGAMNYHLLATVPIEINFNLQGKWTSYALNIKNERKFMPTADRDRLTKEAEKSIQTLFDEEIKDEFKELKVTSIKDYISQLSKSIFNHHAYYENVIDTDVYEATSLVLNTLNQRFTTKTKSSRSLRGMLASGNPIVKLKALRGDYMQRLDTKLKDAVYFRFKESDVRSRYDDDETNEEKYATKLKILKEAGVIFGEEYIKKHKIRSLTKKEKKDGTAIVNADRPIRVWNAGYRSHHEVEGKRAFGLADYYRKSFISSTVGEVNEKAHSNMIIIKNTDKNLWSKVKDRMWATEAPYVIMKPIKGLDTDVIQEWETYVDNLKETELNMMKGENKLPTKLSKKITYQLLMGDSKSLQDLGKRVKKDYSNIIIIKNHQEAFDVRTILDVLGYEIEWSRLDTEDLVKEASGIEVDFTMYCNQEQKDYVYGQLPKYQKQLSKPMFELLLRALASKPYEFDQIISLIEELL